MNALFDILTRSSVHDFEASTWYLPGLQEERKIAPTNATGGDLSAVKYFAEARSLDSSSDNPGAQFATQPRWWADIPLVDDLAEVAEVDAADPFFADEERTADLPFEGFW